MANQHGGRHPRSLRRVRTSAVGAVVAVVALAGLASGCGDDATTAAAPGLAGADDRWRDIDTTRPSEDPVATVYGYVQAMAAGDEQRACAFQHRGSSDHAEDPCLLADELPGQDRRRTADDWQLLAAYELTDYLAEEHRGWRVSLPTEPPTGWRIAQDDAGLWFIR